MRSPVRLCVLHRLWFKTELHNRHASPTIARSISCSVQYSKTGPPRTHTHPVLSRPHPALSRPHPALSRPHPALSRAYTATPAPEAGTFQVKSKIRGIQKDIAPLTTKRIVRRKKTQGAADKDKAVFDVTAFATAEEYRLEELRDDLIKQGLYGTVRLPKDVGDAIHVEARYRVSDEPREIFFFREGSVVFWNIPEVERASVLNFIMKHQEGSYGLNISLAEHEHVEYTHSESKTQLVGDEIQLLKPPIDSPATHHQLEKYAFSNALALSVKLAVWEASLERYVESIEPLVLALRDGKKITMSEAQILRKSGELMTLRHLINLSSDLLDIPDFYWDREPLEALYTRTCNHLTVQRRTKVMNEKLTHCVELSELLRDHLKDKHHTRLEWMIIVLILIEVMFEVCKLIKEFLHERAERKKKTEEESPWNP